jgi:predicted DNA-binding ArsR family transcriptional regulator
MLVSNLQDMIKKNAVSMVDMVDQLNIKKQRLDAILKRFSF